MKIGRYPVASIVLLVLIAAKLAAGYLFPESYERLLPVFDGVLLGAAILFTIYYVWVFVLAWRNSRRAKNDQE